MKVLELLPGVSKGNGLHGTKKKKLWRVAMEILKNFGKNMAGMEERFLLRNFWGYKEPRQDYRCRRSSKYISRVK